ncbi:MAG: hydroxymethylbilane synthase [Planctomycetota bacterium]
MKNKTLKIGTRGSALALFQARAVQSMLREKRPDLQTELVIIKTLGEKDPKTSLVKISGEGIFTRELDTALDEGRIDVAVHSSKDVPTDLSEGIVLAGFCPREEACEAFVSNRHARFLDMPEGARIGTGSPRRRSQILALRPDLAIVDLRGNVETRLRKLDEGQMDAVILACAGLIRLGLEQRISERLPLDMFVPAPGQGAIGIAARSSDQDTLSLVASISDSQTAAAVVAERAFLNRLGGGCKTPIACHATFLDGRLSVHGFVSSPDGTTVITEKTAGPGDQANRLGIGLAESFLAQGAQKILIKE